MSMTLASAELSEMTIDPFHRAGMHQLVIPSHGDALFGTFFRAAGSAPRSTVILLHSLPGYEQHTDLAHGIRRAGFHAVIFHYRGAWGSGGTFSLRHCLEDTRACVAYLRRSDVASSLGIDPTRLILIGHSMGAAMAGLAAASDRAIAGIGMVSPWNMGATSANRTDAFSQRLRQILRKDAQTLTCPGGDAIYEEAARHANWDLTRCAQAWLSRPTLLVTANDLFRPQGMDIAQACRKAGHTALTDTHIATGHMYADSRIALQSHILRWLTQTPSLRAKPEPARQAQTPPRSPARLSGPLKVLAGQARFTQGRQLADMID